MKAAVLCRGFQWKWWLLGRAWGWVNRHRIIQILHAHMSPRIVARARNLFATTAAMFTVCYAWDAAVSVVGHTVVTLLATWVLYRLAYRLLFSGHESVMDSNGRPRHVLVTGCDTGFGNGLAKKLHAKGYHVHAGCLFEMSAAQLNDEYKSTGRYRGRSRAICSHSSLAVLTTETFPTGPRMHALRMDVTSDRDVEQALKKVTDALGDDELWAVVNNVRSVRGASADAMLTVPMLPDAGRHFDGSVYRVDISTGLPTVHGCESHGRYPGDDSLPTVDRTPAPALVFVHVRPPR